jgi:hypothetical protein
MMCARLRFDDSGNVDKGRRNCLPFAFRTPSATQRDTAIGHLDILRSNLRLYLLANGELRINY